jgi:hypothetical protein
MLSPPPPQRRTLIKVLAYFNNTRRRRIPSSRQAQVLARQATIVSIPLADTPTYRFFSFELPLFRLPLIQAHFVDFTSQLLGQYYPPLFYLVVSSPVSLSWNAMHTIAFFDSFPVPFLLLFVVHLGVFVSVFFFWLVATPPTYPLRTVCRLYY